MKTLKTILILILVVGFSQQTEAQILRKLGKTAERAAERTLNKNVEEKASKETDKAFDEVFNKKKKKQKNEEKQDESSNTNSETSTSGGTPENSDLKVYRKFNFVPGDNVILFDDFSESNIGDFPNKWNTSSSGEIVSINNNNAFLLPTEGLVMPYTNNKLPENFTIEFDVIADNISRYKAIIDDLHIIISNSTQTNWGKKYAKIVMPLSQIVNSDIAIYSKGYANKTNGKSAFKTQKLLQDGGYHVSIAVNNQRFRLWINEEKIFDLPRLFDENETKFFKLNTKNLDGNYLLIDNLRIASGGEDKRNDLITKGSMSTSGIYFKSGSSEILANSYGTLQTIAQILNENSSINVEIIGHTDSDGSEDNNLELSKKRAEAVKQVFHNEFGIKNSRMQTNGKGEKEPIQSNDTAEGKAQNRRVEFKKI